MMQVNRIIGAVLLVIGLSFMPGVWWAKGLIWVSIGLLTGATGRLRL